MDRYRRYLEACNCRAWDDIKRFIAEAVMVNGEMRTQDQYVDDVRSTIVTFPDYRWELRRVIVEGEWLAVHLHDVGTRTRAFHGAPGDGSRVRTDEFNMYRVIDGLIHEIEGTADNARLSGQ